MYEFSSVIRALGKSGRSESESKGIRRSHQIAISTHLITYHVYVQLPVAKAMPVEEKVLRRRFIQMAVESRVPFRQIA